MNPSVCYWGQGESNIRVEQITVSRQKQEFWRFTFENIAAGNCGMDEMEKSLVPLMKIDRWQLLNYASDKWKGQSTEGPLLSAALMEL